MRKNLFIVSLIISTLVKAQEFKTHQYFVDWADTLEKENLLFVFGEDTLLQKGKEAKVHVFNTPWGFEKRWKLGDTLMTSAKISCCDSLFTKTVPGVYEERQQFQALQKWPFDHKRRWYNKQGFAYIDTNRNQMSFVVVQHVEDRVFNQVYWKKNSETQYSFYNKDTVKVIRVHPNGDTTLVQERHPMRNYSFYPQQKRWENWFEANGNRIKLHFYNGALDSTYSKGKHEFSYKTDHLTVNSFYFEEEWKYRKQFDTILLETYVHRLKPDTDTKWGMMQFIKSRYTNAHSDFAWSHTYFKKVCPTCYPKVDSVIVLDYDSNRVAKLFYDYSDKENPKVLSKPRSWIKKNDRLRYFMFFPHPKLSRCGTDIPNRMFDRPIPKTRVHNKKVVSQLKLGDKSLERVIEEEVRLNGLRGATNKAPILFIPNEELGYLPLYGFSYTLDIRSLNRAISENSGIKGSPNESITILALNKKGRVLRKQSTPHFIVFVDVN